MYGYIYKTTNLINGKIYIGQHKSDKFDKSYYGSGKRFLNAFNKYGKDNFSCEIIEWCKTREIANDRERYWISYYNTQDRNIGYNITEGGEGWKGGKHTEQSKLKISKSKMGVTPNRIYTTPSHEIRNRISCTLKEYYSIHDNPRKGVKLSDETKEKLRQANLGKKYSEEVKAKHRGKPAWNKGIPMTEEAKENLRKINTGKKYSDKTKEKHRQCWLGENNPNYGGLSESTKQKLRESILGRIWVNNGEVRKQIYPQQLDEYLDNGFVRGKGKF